MWLAPGMDITDAILTRRTHKSFGSEAVDRAVVEELLDLARWAPNHRMTEPWRFRVLGPETFARLVAPKPEEAEKLSRAPTLVVASVTQTGDDYQDREDLLATGCAVYIVLLAAHARGLASFWRTPALFETAEAHAVLGFEERERFVGLINLGTAVDSPVAKPRKPVGEFASFLP